MKIELYRVWENMSYDQTYKSLSYLLCSLKTLEATLIRQIWLFTNHKKSTMGCIIISRFTGPWPVSVYREVQPCKT